MSVHVYRLFDVHNRLLYVGCTSNLTTRFADHGRKKSWWPEVAHHTVSGPYSLKDGRWLEMMAITREGPAYNVHHNPNAVAVPDGPTQREVAAAAWSIGTPAVRIREAIARGELPAHGITGEHLMAWVKSWPKLRPTRRSA